MINDMTDHIAFGKNGGAVSSNDKYVVISPSYKGIETWVDIDELDALIDTLKVIQRERDDKQG